MRKPKERIPLETNQEVLEQYDYYSDEQIFSKQNNYARAIGTYIIAFSRLEASLDSLVASSIEDRSDDPGYRVIRYLKFRDKINFASDQYKLRIHFKKTNEGTSNKLADKLTAQLAIITSKLEELSEFRNKIAHANWMTLDPNGYVRTKIILNDEHFISFKTIKLSPSVILKFTRQCSSLAGKIDSFKEHFI